jgi:DNA-directed RNA polymerase subunit H (RpoH/RPB5)
MKQQDLISYIFRNEFPQHVRNIAKAVPEFNVADKRERGKIARRYKIKLDKLKWLSNNY